LCRVIWSRDREEANMSNEVGKRYIERKKKERERVR